MKKISSLIVCLALLTAGTAFALDLPDALKIPGLTVTGEVKTGLRVDGSTVDDATLGGETGAKDPEVYAYSDAVGDGTPFRAQLSFVLEKDNFGVKTVFRYAPSHSVNSTSTISLVPAGTMSVDGVDYPVYSGSGSSTPATPDGSLSATLNNLNNTIPNAYAYVHLWDKKIKVSLGKGTDAAWGLFWSNFGGGAGVANFDGKDGVKVEVTPIDGLNLGAFYGTGNLFAAAPITDEGSPDRRLVAGAKYSNDLFGVMFSTYHNFREANYDEKDSAGKDIFIKKDPQDYASMALPNTSNLFFGAYVQPIDPLRIDLSILAVNLGSKTVKDENDGNDDPTEYKKGDYNLYFHVFPKLQIGYTVNDQLSAALAITDIAFADMYYYDDADKEEDPGLGHLFPITISPSVNYAINGNVGVGLELNFNINNGGSDQFGFGIKPTATFSLGNGATFVVYDKITLYSKVSDDADFRDKHPLKYTGASHGGSNGTTNTLQFDFVWSF
jgi:hypothetical protein